jgi:hypothetical protein
MGQSGTGTFYTGKWCSYYLILSTQTLITQLLLLDTQHSIITIPYSVPVLKYLPLTYNSIQVLFDTQHSIISTVFDTQQSNTYHSIITIPYSELKYSSLSYYYLTISTQVLLFPIQHSNTHHSLITVLFHTQHWNTGTNHSIITIRYLAIKYSSLNCYYSLLRIQILITQLILFPIQHSNTHHTQL